MWLAGSEPAQVYLAGVTVGVWAPGALEGDVHWEAAASAQDGWLRALDLLAELEPRRRRRRVSLWLSGALARPFMFRPVQGLRRWPDAVRIAAELAPEATGLDGPCEVWMDDWVPSRPCVAVALDAGLRKEIEDSARSHNVRLAAMRPWWTRALNDVLSEASTEFKVIAADEPDAVTILGGTDGRFDSAASYVPKPDVAQMSAVLKRVLLAANALPTQLCHGSLVLDTAAQPSGNGKVAVLPFAPRFESLT